MDQLEVEKLGIPTVTVATSEFITLARSMMEGWGAADMAFAVVPHPMGMIKEDEIRAKADAAYPEIVKLATEWKPDQSKTVAPSAPAYPAERIQFQGSYEELNRMFFDKGWSLGLPIIPPTTEAVEAMLKGTSHKPDEIVWTVPPRMGQLTVELVAALGVMSGCKPEYMPLLLAIVEGMSKPEYDYLKLVTTTQKRTPFIMVNGPIRDELGIAYGAGAGGPGQAANVSIGYFLNLIGHVVGGAKTPNPRKLDQGWPGTIVGAVYGENEEESPWEPFHVEKGFAPSDNVVAVFSGTPPGNNSDHASNNAKDLAENIAIFTLSAGGGIGCVRSSEALVMLTPEHAATIAGDGWTKDDLKKALWENTVLPYRLYPGIPEGSSPSTFNCVPPEDFGPYTDDTLIPVFDSPERFQIVVVGGPGKHTMVFSLFQPFVMVPIDPWK